jgi:ferredoxin
VRLRVTANRATCEGTGYCEQVAPMVFRVGPAGVVELRTDEASEADADAVLEAEALCPTRSLRTRVED